MLGDRPNQIERQRPDVSVTRRAAARRAGHAAARSPRPASARTSRVGIQYLDSWLRGTGAAAIYNLMEDVATAEISRSQIWQWIAPRPRRPRARARRSPTRRSRRCRRTGRASTRRVSVFEQVALADDFVDFLTLPAYELLS